MEYFNEFYQSSRGLFEFLYFIATYAIAFAAIFSLNQIRVLKKNLNVQSKRDALKITSTQCENYMAKIIPLQDALHQAIKINKITFFEGWDVELTKKDVKVSRKTPLNANDLKVITDELAVFNHMETFASFFTTRIGDSQIADGTIVETVLSFVRHFMH